MKASCMASAAVSESPTIQDVPPAIPLAASEADPVIAPAAEPVVPKTRRGDLVGINDLDIKEMTLDVFQEAAEPGDWPWPVAKG